MLPFRCLSKNPCLIVSASLGSSMFSGTLSSSGAPDVVVRGTTQPVSSKQEAEKVWEPKFIGEIVSGKDPRKPPAPPAAEGMTVADFLDGTYERYVVAESLRSIASIRSRLSALKEGLGTLPVNALERTDTIEDFKREYGKTRSLVAVNRTLGILRHAMNWGRGRTPRDLHGVALPSIRRQDQDQGRDKTGSPDCAGRRATAAGSRRQTQLRRARVRGRSDARSNRRRASRLAAGSVRC